MKSQLLAFLLIPVLFGCGNNSDKFVTDDNSPKDNPTSVIAPKQIYSEPSIPINILKDKDIEAARTIAFDPKERVPLTKYNNIILHHTAMSSDEDALGALKDSLFSHYLVLKTGEIVQLLDTDIVAEGSLDDSVVFESDALGVVNVKIQAIKAQLPLDHQGVHIEINYAPQKGELPNEAQLAATSKLIAYLSLKFGIKPTGLIAHATVQPCFTQVFVDPNQGDGCKFNEPAGIFFNYNTDRDDLSITKSDGLYPIVAQVRQLGAWKNEAYFNLSDKAVAELIYNRNYENAA